MFSVTRLENKAKFYLRWSVSALESSFKLVQNYVLKFEISQHCMKMRFLLGLTLKQSLPKGCSHT